MCRWAGLELFIKHNTMTWMPGHEEGQRRFYHKHQCDFLTGLHWGGLLKIWPKSLISLSLCCNLPHGSEEIGYILMLQMWLFLIFFFFFNSANTMTSTLFFFLWQMLAVSSLWWGTRSRNQSRGKSRPCLVLWTQETKLDSTLRGRELPCPFLWWFELTIVYQEYLDKKLAWFLATTVQC